MLLLSQGSEDQKAMRSQEQLEVESVADTLDLPPASWTALLSNNIEKL